MKIRLRYTKLGAVRFVSHRDGARLWERALRKVGLPVAYTEGFTPRPKLSFGLALPTGAESIAEYIDVDVDGDLDLTAALGPMISDALPVGMDVAAIAEADPAAGSLQQAVTSTTWELRPPDVAPEEIRAACQRLLDSATLLVERERKGRRQTDDVRHLIVDLQPAADGGLVAELVTDGRALRPAELATAAFPSTDPVSVRVLRTHQWITHDGARREVLPVMTERRNPRALSRRELSDHGRLRLGDLTEDTTGDRAVR